jgi:hypothetical protein
MKSGQAQGLYAIPMGWIVYGFTMVVICLTLTFPYDQLHAVFLLHLSEKTGIDIRTERWSPRLPSGVVWTHLSILLPGLSRIDIEQIQVEVKLGSLLLGQPVLLWSGRIGGRDGSNGLLKGELSMASLPWNGPAQILGSIDHFDLSRLALPSVKRPVVNWDCCTGNVVLCPCSDLSDPLSSPTTRAIWAAMAVDVEDGPGGTGRSKSMTLTIGQWPRQYRSVIHPFATDATPRLSAPQSSPGVLLVPYDLPSQP